MAFNFTKTLNATSTQTTPTSAASEAGASTTAGKFKFNIKPTQVQQVQQVQQAQPEITKQAIPSIPVDNAQSSDQSNTGVANESQQYQTQIILSNLAELQAKLEAKIPDLHNNLRIIMKSIQADPAQVTILTPDQRSIIFKSMSTIADIDLVLDAAKAAKKKIDLSAPENSNLFE